MDWLYSLPGSSVHGILQARILEWVAVPFSRGSSQPRDQTQVSCIASGFFTVWATREAQEYQKGYVAYPFSNWSSRPRKWIRVSYIAGGLFISWAPISDLKSDKHMSYLLWNSYWRKKWITFTKKKKKNSEKFQSYLSSCEGDIKLHYQQPKYLGGNRY